jgi:threonine/homoserine/homoserine lactone efflux protein
MELPMFPIEVFIAYTTACVLLVLSPGPDNLLAVGRGLSQGKLAALVSDLALMGVFASRLVAWLKNKPKVVSGLNVGAGLTFLGSGYAIALMRQR